MKTFRVLSIDGGGVWGIGVAKFIAEYECRTGKKFCDQFHAFAGTSTGAIIAALLAEGRSGIEIYDLYKKESKNIFKKQPWYKKLNPFEPKYDNTSYIKILKRELNGNMGDYSKPVFITASKSIGEQEKVFDRGDETFPKWKAVQCSSAAPTYFDPVDNVYMDGGLWANNPCDCLQAGLVDSEINGNYKMLSFATGGNNIGKKVGKMNIATWAIYLINNWLAKSGEGASYRVKKNIGSENFLRVKPLVMNDEDYPLDAVDKMQNIEDIWMREFDISFGMVKYFIEK